MPLPRVAVWALSVVLALTFGFVGVSKLRGQSAARWHERFSHWGYPSGSQYAVGTVEILAGIGLVILRTRRIAAGIVIGVMVGAVGTHLLHGELPRVIPPLVLGGAASLVYCGSLHVRRPPGQAS